MAVTAAQMLQRQDTNIISVVPNTSTILYGNTICFVDAATGYATDVDNSGANKFLAIVRNTIDNSGGTAGDVEGDGWTCGRFLLTGSGFGITDTGKAVYASDNFTVTLTSSGNTYIGTIDEYVSSTQVWVNIDTSVQSTVSEVNSTNAAAFEVDIDATTPKIAISGDSGGTGNFTATIKPPTTLTADRTFTLVGDANATLVNVATAQTLTNKTLTAPVLGVATGTSLAVTGALTSSSPSAGIGYATGAGATVTQITNRSTGVTINALCGTITTDSTSLAAEGSADFIVTNTSVGINDVIILNIRSGENSGGTVLSVQDVAAGSFAIRVHNGNAAGGTAETGAIVINFAVLKAVVA